MRDGLPDKLFDTFFVGIALGIIVILAGLALSAPVIVGLGVIMAILAAMGFVTVVVIGIWK